MGWIALGDAKIDTAETNARAQEVATGVESLGVANADAIAIHLCNDLPFLRGELRRLGAWRLLTLNEGAKVYASSTAARTRT
jgi:non-ribosomal peptide synthetase component E (peptide arylation enzyme)